MAQKGSGLLLKIGDGASPEIFTAAAGLRSKTITFSDEEVDVTSDDDTTKWRQLLEGGGIKSAAVSGSGVFKDDAAAETIRAAFFAGTHYNYQVVIPAFGTVEGPFQITQLEYAGEHNGEATYSLGLASAGALAFTAA